MLTNKQMILNILADGEAYSCSDITKIIIHDRYPKGAPYLNGSISSILAKMVKDGKLEYGKGNGPKGGHLYQIPEPK